MTATEAPGLHLDFHAYLDATLAAHKRMLNAHADYVRALMQPVQARTGGSASASSSGVAIIGLSGPDMGRIRYVRSLVVGGISPSTAAAGKADVFVGASRTVTDPAALSLLDWRDQAATLPLIAFYGRGEISLRHNERCWIVVSSGTSGQEYVAGVTFEEFEEGNLTQEWGL